MKTLLIIVALLPFSIFAQVTRQPLTVRYTSLGAYSKNFVDLFSGSSNQAALAQLKTGGFGVYGERRFMLNELNQYSGIFALPTRSGTFALQADYFGFSGMNENQLGLAYGRSLSSRMDVGIKFNYHAIKVAGYGNASTVNFEAGTIFHLTEQLHAGFHIYNPFSSTFSKNNTEKLPAIFKTGLGYEASKKVFISAEVIKQEDEPVNVNVGLQYNLQEKVLLRTGISTANNNSFAGVGIYLGNVRLDVNASYHPQLGFTPGILLLYNFKKAPEN